MATRSLNEVKLIGNLGGAPELRKIGNDRSVCEFSIATTDSWVDRDTGEKKEHTEWHNIVAWGRWADVCGQYLEKGSQVYVCGKLKTERWEDDNGVKREKKKVVINDMIMLGGSRQAANNDARPQNQPAQKQPVPNNTPAATEQGGWGTIDDDVPF